MKMIIRGISSSEAPPPWYVKYYILKYHVLLTFMVQSCGASTKEKDYSSILIIMNTIL